MNGHLRHVQAGLVSVTKSGDAFAVTFEQALTLDESHQVSRSFPGVMDSHWRIVADMPISTLGTNATMVSLSASMNTVTPHRSGHQASPLSCNHAFPSFWSDA